MGLMLFEFSLFPLLLDVLGVGRQRYLVKGVAGRAIVSRYGAFYVQRHINGAFSGCFAI
jgi:hypothetical protein